MPIPPALDLVFKISPTPGLILSPDRHQFTVTAINDEFSKLTGWAEKEVLGKDFVSLLSQATEGKNASHSVEIQLSLEHVLTTGAAHTVPALEYCLDNQENAENQKRCFELQHIPVKNDEQKVIHILHTLKDITEQVRLKEIVQEKDDSFWQLLQNLPVAAYLSDPEGNILFYNKPAATLWGEEPPIGRNLWKGSWKVTNLDGSPLKPDSCPMTLALTHGKIKSGKEIFMQQGNGEKRNVLPYPVPLFHPSGEIRGALNMLVDITAHKSAQKALEESEHKYRQIVETAREGIWMLDKDDLTVFVNNELCQILGYSKEEMLGKTVFPFMDDKGKEIMKRLFLKKKEKYTRHSRFKYIAKGGKEIWTNISANPLFDEEDNYIGSLAMLTDITEKKKAEEKLAKNEKKLREAQEIAQFGSWEFDFQTQKQILSEEACRIYGIPPDKNKQTIEEFLTFVHPDDRDELVTQMNSSKATFSESTFNHRIVLRNGTIKHIYGKARYEFDKNGNPTGVVGITQDVTELRKAEYNLQKQNKELIKANKELDHFVYSVSHDLRSPLTSILGLISIIEEESKEEETLKHIKMIETSIHRLDGFIKNILSYSQNNRIEVTAESIPLQEMVKAIVDSLSNIREAKGIDFKVDIVEKQPFHSDKQRVDTILQNLISNAIKYHKDEEPGRFIKIEGIADAKKLEISISDNGMGIDPRHHHKIFDMFFRLSGKTTGSGIGLYIVKDTIEKLDGTIKVESVLNRGSTFTVTLKNLK